MCKLDGVDLHQAIPRPRCLGADRRDWLSFPTPSISVGGLQLPPFWKTYGFVILRGKCRPAVELFPNVAWEIAGRKGAWRERASMHRRTDSFDAGLWKGTADAALSQSLSRYTVGGTRWRMQYLLTFSPVCTSEQRK